MSGTASLAQVTVGLGDWSVARAPGRLAAFGLGSCVAIFLYDAQEKIGGLAHAIVPFEPRGSPGPCPGRYIPMAIRGMIAELVEAGAARGRLRAKVVGGASMFRWSGGAERGQTIGLRNVEAAMRCLRSERIRVSATDVGGRRSRSVIADLDSTLVRTRSLRGVEREI
jgi:chemotaxis protein CheD